ncbi:MAG TPA: glycosyltransferase, partial [Saprospiraceae bacterium]|nr:glycosyltransferase [Saprospiraceae bacterium]
MAPFKKVLICPQHWGLGHVTRTIPVIRYFLQRADQVVLASSGAGSELLRKEFPLLQVYELPDYGITYPFKSMYLNIGLHFIRMHVAIWKEHWAVRRICRKEGIDLIVSDARLGASQKGIASVIISHHLHFSLGFSFVEWCCDTWMRLFYLSFDQLWIPDLEGPVNLSGDLAHRYRSKKHYFIGALSRFRKKKLNVRYDYAFVLSGPEPQRSYLENRILDQVARLYPSKCILVRGSSQAPRTREELVLKYPDLEVRDLVTSEELNDIMCASGLIVCRSGYSTLLDLYAIEKPALLIPTPGQPEQEYLAEELMRKKMFFMVSQDELILSRDVFLARDYAGYSIPRQQEDLHSRLDSLLAKLPR